MEGSWSREFFKEVQMMEAKKICSPFSGETAPLKKISPVKDNMLPCEEETHRVTIEYVEKIRSAARDNQNPQMLAWACLMQEILYIRDLLEQQNQPRNSGNNGKGFHQRYSGCTGTARNPAQDSTLGGRGSQYGGGEADEEGVGCI